jgi:hypothetical protein
MSVAEHPQLKSGTSHSRSVPVSPQGRYEPSYLSRSLRGVSLIAAFGLVAEVLAFNVPAASAATGTVGGWGYNAHGETTPPPGPSHVVAVSAGTFFSLAL